jgi:hypothetical protein
MFYDTLLLTFPLFICNSNIVNVLTIRNIRLFSLQSPGSHQIEQRTFHCEHSVKSFRFSSFSITISCIQMCANYRYKSWTIKIHFPPLGYMSGLRKRPRWKVVHLLKVYWNSQNQLKLTLTEKTREYSLIITRSPTNLRELLLHLRNPGYMKNIAGDFGMNFKSKTSKSLSFLSCFSEYSIVFAVL